MILQPYPNNTNALPGDIERNEWSIRFEESDDESQWLRGSMCRSTPGYGGSCWPTVQFFARGWSEDELLQVFDTLAPVNAQTWPALEQQFIDPRPLDQATSQLLSDVVQTLEPRDGTLHVATEERMRVDRSLRLGDDPYHLPVENFYPKRQTIEMWQRNQGDDIMASRFIRRGEDDALAQVQFYTPQTSGVYDRSWTGSFIGIANQVHWSGENSNNLALGMVTALLSNQGPITESVVSNAVILEQEAGTPRDWTNGPFQPWLGGLSPGRVTQRLTIDRATLLPQRLEVIHTSTQGQRTLLKQTTLTAYEWLSDQPGDEFYTFPELPDDAIVFDDRPSATSETLNGPLNFPLPKRALVWPESSGAVVSSNFDPPSSTINTLYAYGNVLLRRALEARIDDPNNGVTLTKRTEYTMPPGDWNVTIRQGSRELLTRILRYNEVNPMFGDAAMYLTRSSKPIKVTVAGQERTAWLINQRSYTALVVEVDEVLLFITSDDTAYLEGTVAQMLSELVWIDVIAKGQSTPPAIPVRTRSPKPRLAGSV